MKHAKTVAAGVIALAIFPSLAEAGFRLKGSFGLVGETTQEVENKFTQVLDYSPASGGISYVGKGGTYVDLSYAAGSGSGIISGTKREYEREDESFTLGHIWPGGWALFTGWRAGDGVMKGVSSVDTLHSEGPVLGISKAFSISEKNVIALTAAAGFLTATWDLMGPGESDGSSGLSLAASYTFKASQRVAFGVEFRTQQYQFDFPATATTLGNPESVVESQSFTSAFASFSF